MNKNEERVHHAIIDLYELDDAGDVTLAEVADKTGMPRHVVGEAVAALEQQGVIATKRGSVIMVDNLDYYPTTRGHR